MKNRQSEGKIVIEEMLTCVSMTTSPMTRVDGLPHDITSPVARGGYGKMVGLFCTKQKKLVKKTTSI